MGARTHVWYEPENVGEGKPFIDRLSPSQKSIFFDLCSGMTTKEIAEKMQISIWTVKKQIELSRYKIGADSVVQLVFLVMRDRLERQKQRQFTVMTSDTTRAPNTTKIIH